MLAMRRRRLIGPATAHWTRLTTGCVLAGGVLLGLLAPGPAVAQPCTVDQITFTTGDPNFPNLNGEPSISADGLFITFQSDAEPVAASNPEGNFEIWLYSVAADSFSQLTVTGGPGSSVRPAISGDGLWVVFEGASELFPGGVRQIALFDVTAASLLQITNVASGSVLYPEINNDGTLIAFVSTADIVAGGNSDGNRELFLYDRTAGIFTQVTTTTGGDTDLSTLNGAGTLVAFNSTADVVPGGNADGSSEIFLYDILTATMIQITGDIGGGSYSPTLSTDGEWIALHSDRDLVPGSNLDASIEVYLYDIAGTTFTQVTNLTGPESYSPSINDDGTKVAFASFNNPAGNNSDGNNELFLFDVPSSEITQVTDTVGPGYFYMMSASLSGNGESIAFESFSDVTGDNPDFNGEVYLASCAPDEPEQPSPAIPVASRWGLIALATLIALAAFRLVRKGA